jgi:hypothetical protein
MSKSPTAKNLRVGQTIYYAAYVLGRSAMVYQLRSIVVLSDKASLPEPGLIAEGFPRHHIRGSIKAGLAPRLMSYSRRKVLSWIKAQKVAA